MPKSKTNPIVLWLYKLLHETDDYSVRVNTPYKHVLLESHSTPWMFKAFCKYIQFHFKYPNHTITLVHHKYTR